MSFVPIALVGQGCILPGASSPDALWEAVEQGRDLTTPAPKSAWPVEPDKIIGPDGEAFRNGSRQVPQRGGFITGFDEVFNTSGFRIPEDEVATLDRSVRWLFDVARQAMRQARIDDLAARRSAVVLGNNSYPSASLVEIAQRVYLEEPLGLASRMQGDTPEGRRYWANRYSSGRPAHLLARAIGADGPAFCLDAACASSLYAIKIACDYLQDGAADIAIAGAISGTDNIFLHLGFSEIKALSKTGKSSPFSRQADGLLPAEGAAALVLKRLDDAIADRDDILGVIRGVGLSNDGRRGGLLAPDRDGQISAIRRAYEMADIAPSTISMLECHATGTPTGDRIELTSAQAVFGGSGDLPVGSLKSNLGHLITAAGAGALIKVTQAMRRGKRPATIHAEDPIDEFKGSFLRLLKSTEDWPEGDGRRAGISNFGFGGNNAHLILEEYRPDRPVYSVVPPVSDDPVVICGVGVIAGGVNDLDDLSAVLGGRDVSAANSVDGTETVLKGLKFPPNDLKNSLAQQTAILAASRNAMEGVGEAAAERCGALIGMSCDIDAARPGLRYRLGAVLERAGVQPTSDQEKELVDAIGGLTGQNYVMGSMPNLPANRINVQFDWRGLGYTVASEELSGACALEIASRALKSGELDLVLAGAADFSRSTVDDLAAEAVLPASKRQSGDAAVVFVLKRRSDAEKAGDPILAELDVAAARRAHDEQKPASGDGHPFGYAHAVDSILDVACLLAKATSRAEIADQKPGISVQTHPQSVSNQSFTGQSQTVTLSNIGAAPGFGLEPDAPHMFFAAAEDIDGLKAALASRAQSADGKVRVSIVAPGREELERKIAVVIGLIEQGRPVVGPGVAFGDSAIEGEIAFVYPGSAAAYVGMGEASGVAFPEIISALEATHAPGLDRAIKFRNKPVTAADYLFEAAATTLVATLNTRILRDHLGVIPNAALGVSIGEGNMLVANDVWKAPETIMDDLEAEDFYEQLAINHQMIAKEWGLPAGEPVQWENYEIFAPVSSVQAAVENLPRCWVTIVVSPNQCMIGGSADDCAQALKRLPDANVVRSDTDLAFHGHFAHDIGDFYLRAHTRPVTGNPAMRFYFNARHDVVEQDSDAFARCFRDQGVNPIDFRPTVLKAWDDGVRVFVDIGPRSGMKAAIKATLGDKPHLVVGMDSRNRDSLLQLTEAAGVLFAAGLPVDLNSLSARLARLRGERTSRQGGEADDKKLSISTHLPPVETEVIGQYRKRDSDMSRIPEKTAQDMQFMPLPPYLAPPVGLQMTFPVPQETPPAADPAEKTSAPEAAAVETPKPPKPESASANSSGFDAAPGCVTPIEILPPEGPAFNREQLEILAGGKISEVFGPLFAQQDGYKRQCRMPQPPLLLADRVLGMAGEPGSMGTGVCWTETDITRDAWYLHHGYMPTGLLIESGQADLLLISWLGADFLNRDERVYRLLGCEITFHDGPLPTVDDTVRFQIHIDSHAKLGDTRLFFFRYDARIGDRLVSSVRSGQAGFFSDEELANSAGVLWSPEKDAPAENAKLDPAPCPSAKSSFSHDDVRAFAAGNAFACFGAGFELAAAHQRTPGIPSGRMQLIDHVSAFDPAGGPWGRGYIKAEYEAPTDAWFYDGHFKNDPCMPGTLMAEAATQTLAFYMAALGFTQKRDGWIFRPVTEEAFKFVCRGQVIPDKPHAITYEIFVEDIIDGDEPTIYAALLASCDGHKVFLCRRFGMKLARDWPLYHREAAHDAASDPRIVSPTGDVPGDHRALLACAWGRPSDAFGSMYERFDRESSVPRLPGPPYHCVSRIVSADCEPGTPTPGGKVVAEFDVKPDAWYFADGGNGVMPFSFLSEVLLQPCGWLASYMGFALAGDLKFRNLDGSDVLLEREVRPDAGVLTIEATFTRSVVAGPMTIVFYEVVCRSAEGVILSLKTDFGFFPADALASQKGLPVTDAMRAALAEPSPVDVASIAEDRVSAGRPVGKLAMVDAVTGFWPGGGKAGLGRVTGRQRIDPSSWYFKAHFYEDPVQPGSLGLEALFSLFKAAVNLKGLTVDFQSPRFEAPAAGSTLGWKYRGQVVPTNKEVITEIDIVSVVQEGDTVLVTADGSLWADGLRIYEVSGYAIRICEAKPGAERASPEPEGAAHHAPAVDLSGWTVDLRKKPWLKDHCPTYCLPVYPMLAIAGDLLNAKRSEPLTALEDLELSGWLRLDQGPVSLTSKTFPMADGRISRQLFRRDGDRERRVGRVCEPTVASHDPAPAPWTDVAIDGERIDPYASGELFHFEAFQVARDLARAKTESRFWIDAGDALERADGDPAILLDGIAHGFPHMQPALWFGEAARDMAAFPYRIEKLQLYGPLPEEGRIDVFTRAAGMPTPRTIKMEIQAQKDGVVILELTMIEVLLPLGHYGKLAPTVRRAFAGDSKFVESWSVADISGDGAVVDRDLVNLTNWLPGTLEAIYGLPVDGSVSPEELCESIAVKDYYANRFRLHPSEVRIDGDRIMVGADRTFPASEFEGRWFDDGHYEIRHGEVVD